VGNVVSEIATVPYSGDIKIIALDHIVLNTVDTERSLAWYTQVLGLGAERVEEWRKGEAPFPSVRINADTIIDLFQVERTGENMNHLCLVMPADDWEAMLVAGHVVAERGPNKVFGAQGIGESIYTRDPEGNLVELRRY
jgi:catechol 2,3-dioxygenase-like lactoylglutathione lyase family enzyme